MPWLLLTIAALWAVFTATCEGFNRLKPAQIRAAQAYEPGPDCPLLKLPSPMLPQNDTHAGHAFFRQPIHHSDPNLGYFHEFYHWNATFWRGPGSPIVVFLAGENDATGFDAYALPEFSIVGVIAENLGAAVIIIEHRYYGQSSPFADLTTANLTYLTVENALKDIVNLARNFEAPWAPRVPTTAQDVPFVLIGGSYSGGQVGWIANSMAGTFWAYLALSPLIQAISDYWQYMLPAVEQGDPSCINDLAEIVAYVDGVLMDSSDLVKAQQLKELFGLGGVNHNDDFMRELMLPVLSWSEFRFSHERTDWDDLCDAVTNHSVPSSKGNSPPQALDAFARYFRDEWASGVCYDGHCYSSYDAGDPTFTDTSLSNILNRQLYWLRCNDNIGGWVAGAPTKESNITLISQLIMEDYWRRQCELFFPLGPDGETYRSSTRIPIQDRMTDAKLNAYTGGWNPTKARRIIYSSGTREVWHEMTVSAELRSNGPMKGDPSRDVVVDVVPGGSHGTNLLTKAAELNPEVKRIRDRQVVQVCEWVQQWYMEHM
jgi:hypothetical protein